MNYYGMRQEAYQMIDKMLESGTPKAVIVFKISTKFGLNEKIVNERTKMWEDFRLERIEPQKSTAIQNLKED